MVLSLSHCPTDLRWGLHALLLCEKEETSIFLLHRQAVLSWILNDLYGLQFLIKWKFELRNGRSWSLVCLRAEHHKFNLHFHPGHHKVLKTPVHGIGWKTNSELMNKQTDTVDSGPAWNNRAVLYTGPAELELYAICFFSNSLIIEQPKTKEIVDLDVFGYLMKNSSFLHP